MSSMPEVVLPVEPASCEVTGICFAPESLSFGEVGVAGGARGLALLCAPLGSFPTGSGVPSLLPRREMGGSAPYLTVLGPENVTAMP